MLLLSVKSLILIPSVTKFQGVFIACCRGEVSLFSTRPDLDVIFGLTLSSNIWCSQGGGIIIGRYFILHAIEVP